MKPSFRFTLLIISFMAIVCAGILYMGGCTEFLSRWLRWPVYVTSEPVVIDHQNPSPGNQLQPYASVRMTIENDKLYLYIPLTNHMTAGPYDGYLCVFEDGCLKKVKDIPHGVLDLWNGKAYYNVSEDPILNTLICYQIASEEDVPVVSYEHRISQTESARTGAEGEIYYPAADSSSSYYRIHGTKVLEIGPIDTTYCFGDMMFTHYRGRRDGEYITTIIATDTEGNVIRDYKGAFGNGSCRIIPCENGILIHNAISPDMLYFVDGVSGEIIELFSVDAERTISTVNVYNEFVYLSFLRYLDYDQMWFGLYKNDSLSGTYRISLTDYSVEKISDIVYDGLFIFDDSGIFACDRKNNVYKLDFEGNLIMTLLEH